MAEQPARAVPKGTWVELYRVVLAPDARAPQVPAETKCVPLEMRVKGVLLHDARQGEEAEIITPAGRRLRGTVQEVNPGYTHGFGPPEPALRGIGAELRDLLASTKEQA